MASNTVIKVLGLGGGGSNAVNRMVQLGIEGVHFIAANTDAQALANSEAPEKILMGQRASHGLGAGGIPAKGEEAAEESAEAIADALEGADMVFLAAGMGGGTGTGAIPVAARIAKQTGAVTVAVVTTPFTFEGTRRFQNAKSGINKLRTECDTLIAVPNDKLLSILPRDVTFELALRAADEVLRQGVQGMAELVTRAGLINVDFANVQSLMQLKGGAFLSMGYGRGASKAMDAIHDALHHKLLDADVLNSAAGVLAHFTGGGDLSLFEIGSAMEMVNRSVQPGAQIVMGATIDEAMDGRAQVILVVTGVREMSLGDASAADQSEAPQPAPAPEPALAGALFANVQPHAAQRLEWVVENEVSSPTQSIAPENLDLPAFMRRRRLFATK